MNQKKIWEVSVAFARWFDYKVFDSTSIMKNTQQEVPNFLDVEALEASGMILDLNPGLVCYADFEKEATGVVASEV